MESYQLVISVLVFLGVLGLIVLLDCHRREKSTQFRQLHQVMTACLESLRVVQAGTQTETALISEALGLVRASLGFLGETAAASKQALEALAMVQVAVQTGTQTASKDSLRFSQEITLAAKEMIGRVEANLLQQQKAREEANDFFVTKLSEVVKSASEDLLKEGQRTADAVHDLQTSLEASVKF